MAAVRTGSTEAAPSVPAADAVKQLLWGYQQLIDEAEAIRHRPPFARRLVSRGTAGFAAEHVRRALVTLDRRYAAHEALSDDPDEDVLAGRARVDRFLASLPPSPTRWRTLLLAAGVLVVARFLLALIVAEAPADSGDTDELTDAVTAIGDANLANIGEAVEVLVNTSLLTTWLVATVFGFAAYLVLRPLATGWISFRALRHGESAAAPRWYAREREVGDRLRLDEREAEVFEAHGMRRLPDSGFDLATKACIAAPLLIGAVGLWLSFLSAPAGSGGGDIAADGGQAVYLTFTRDAIEGVIALVLGVLGITRVTWLTGQWRARRARRPPVRAFGRPVLASLVALAAAFGLLALQDNRPPSVAVAAAPIDERVLSERTFEIRFGCAEDCDIEDVRLVDASGNEPADPHLVVPDMADNGYAPSSQLEDDMRYETENLATDGFDVSEWPTQRIDIELSRDQASWLAQEQDCPEDDFIDPCGRALSVRLTDFHGNAAEVEVPLAPATQR